MFAAINSFLTGALAKVTDVYWPFVSMLLHGDSPQQFNQDISTNVFPITAVGAVQASTRTPFTGGPSSYGSGYFNGSTGYLTVPDNAAFTLGTNDFTVEAWIYATATGQVAICGQTNAAYATANTSMTFYRLTDGRIACFVAYNSGSSFELITTLTAPLSTWTHVAAVRDGATLRVYVSGVQSATATISTGVVNDSASLFAIGRPGDFAGQYFPGYISNFRLVNGTCLYPSGTTFIPPTTALTAVSGTSLLTLQNATIVDNSTNAFTITNNGTVVTSVQSPFLVSTVLTADSSGNGNNWTPNNISLTAGSTYDSLTDVPTLTSTTVANYAVLNPLDSGSSTLSINGNLSWVNAAASHLGIRGSIAIPASGAFYMEAIEGSITTINSVVAFGLGTSTVPLNASFSGAANIYYLWSGGYIYAGATIITSSLGFFNAGDVLQIAVDATNTKMWVGKNNVWYNNTGGTTGNPSTGANPTFTTSMVGLFPIAEAYANSLAFNFGQQPFTYTPPSGFLPLNTFNI
jgi:hypothetical protein